jgi:DNA-binding NarL/FixJ family response regulator
MTGPHAFPEGRVSRILIADDEPNVRFALKVLLGQQAELRVAGEAGDARALLGQMQANCADVVLLDWDLGGVTADDLLPVICQLCPRTAVIVLSGKPGIRQAALAAGADAFISKADPPEQLLRAVRSARRE